MILVNTKNYLVYQWSNPMFLIPVLKRPMKILGKKKKKSEFGLEGWVSGSEHLLSFQRTGLYSQNPHNGSQPSVTPTPVPRNPMSFMTYLLGTRAHSLQTYMQAYRHTHTVNISLNK